MCFFHHFIWTLALVFQRSTILSATQEIKENAEKSGFINHRSILHLTNIESRNYSWPHPYPFPSWQDYWSTSSTCHKSSQTTYNQFSLEWTSFQEGQTSLHGHISVYGQVMIEKLSPAFYLIDTFSSHFSFHSVNRKDTDAKITYYIKLDIIYKNFLINQDIVLIILNASIKNNTATSVSHICWDQHYCKNHSSYNECNIYWSRTLCH